MTTDPRLVVTHSGSRPHYAIPPIPKRAVMLGRVANPFAVVRAQLRSKLLRMFGPICDKLTLSCPEPIVVGQRGVITTFNNNLHYQRSYVQYYRRVWKPDWIISLIGADTPPHDGVPLGLFSGCIVKDADDHYEVWYQAPATQAPDSWHLMRDRLIGRVKQYFIATRILVTDCDEFIYGNVDQLWQMRAFWSHFVEHVPTRPFDPNETSTWSTQAWYYRRQFKESALTAQSASSSIKIDHRWCKCFDLARGKCGYHASGKFCQFTSPFEANGRSVTFHVGVASKEHFLHGKHWDQASEKGGVLTGDQEQLLAKFSKYYETCRFPTFEFRLWDLLEDSPVNGTAAPVSRLTTDS